MARKTKEDTQATREGILDAAEACFHEHGVARTTLEMIGARAGYTAAPCTGISRTRARC